MDETTPIIPITKTPIKWRGVFVVVGGILMHLTFGTTYTFGNMTPYVTSYLRVKGVSDVTYGDSVWIYSGMVSVTGIAMYIGGLLERRLGPRIAACIGCSILSGGVGVSFFTIKSSFGSFLVTYGLMFGLGKGIGYAVPLACAIRWFPHRTGLVSGLVVAGIGGGSFIFDQIQTVFINPTDEKPKLQLPGDVDKYFAQPDVLDRLPTCFLLLAGLYSALQIVGIMLITNPPSFTYKETDIPANDESTSIQANTSISTINNSGESIPDKAEFTPLAMLKTFRFYNLWLVLLLVDHGVGFVSSLWKAYGQTFIHDDRFLAYVGAFSSVGNASGRIVWGYVGDRFSFKVAFLFVCTIFSALIATLQVTQYGGRICFFAWVFLLFFSFSGTFPLLSSETARVFGHKNYAMNYGLILTAGTVSGITVALLTSQLQLILGWNTMFVAIAGIVLIGLIFIYIYNDKIIPIARKLRPIN